MKRNIQNVRQETKCIMDEVQYAYGRDGYPYEYFTDKEIDILIQDSRNIYCRNNHMVPFLAAYKLISIFLKEFDSDSRPERCFTMCVDEANIESIRTNHKNLKLLISNNSNDFDYCYGVIKK